MAPRHRRPRSPLPRRRWLRWQLLAATLVAAALYHPNAVAEPAHALGAPSPLGQAQRQALLDITPDPPPAKLLNGQHYVVSDEGDPQRYREVVAHRGGMLVGVGTDQNYLFAAWARPSVLVLLDFDQVVVDLHRAYREFFLHAAEPEAFVDLWAPKSAARTSELLKRTITSTAERARVEHALRIGRHLVWARLTQMRRRYALQSVPSYLTEQEQYDYVVALLRAGRVHAVRGDVTGEHAMRGVAQAARRLGLPVRLLYLSNIEQYVRYGDAFRRNLLELPVDDRSLVLRTYHPGGKQSYYYFVQRSRDLHGWLERADVRGLADLLWRPGTKWRTPLIWLAGPQHGAAAPAQPPPSATP